MATQHHDNGALAACSVGDCVAHFQEVACDEDIGERLQECRKAAILSGGRSKLAGGDFVRSPLDGDGPDLGEISFLGLAAAAVRGGAARLSLTA